jgi:hypothetical protein
LKIKFLFIFFLNLIYINTQICTNINILDTDKCTNVNSSCDNTIKLCKCKNYFYGKQCENEKIKTSVKIINGINTGDFSLLLIFSIIAWIFGVVIGIVVIFMIFYFYGGGLKKIVPNITMGYNNTTEQMVIIDINNNTNTNNMNNKNNNYANTSELIQIPTEEKQLDCIKILISNIELEIEKSSLNNINVQNIIENINSYLKFCKVANKTVLENICYEIENLFIYVKNNNIEFLNFEIKRFERQFEEIKNMDKNTDKNTDRNTDINTDRNILNIEPEKYINKQDEYIEVKRNDTELDDEISNTNSINNKDNNDNYNIPTERKPLKNKIKSIDVKIPVTNKKNK